VLEGEASGLLSLLPDISGFGLEFSCLFIALRAEGKWVGRLLLRAKYRLGMGMEIPRYLPRCFQIGNAVLISI
jgi:hypothetical protein